MTNNAPERDATRAIDDRLVSCLTGANAAWPEAARQQMLAMVDQIAKSNDHTQRIVGYDSSVPRYPLKGGR